MRRFVGFVAALLDPPQQVRQGRLDFQLAHRPNHLETHRRIGVFERGPQGLAHIAVPKAQFAQHDRRRLANLGRMFHMEQTQQLGDWNLHGVHSWHVEMGHPCTGEVRQIDCSP